MKKIIILFILTLNLIACNSGTSSGDNTLYTTQPANNATHVQVDSSILIYFNNRLPESFIKQGVFVLIDESNNKINISTTLDNNIATIKPVKELNVLTKYKLNIILPSNGTQYLTASESAELSNITFETGTSSKVIFVTHNAYNISKLYGADFSGLNNTCNTEAQQYYPDLYNQGIRFKALFAGNKSTTIYTKYYRVDGVTLIAEATGNNLSTRVVNSIISTQDELKFWTGLAPQGVVTTGPSSSNNCKNWTDKSSPGNGYIGHANRNGNNSNGNDWNDSHTKSCKDNYQIACVAQ